MQFQNGYLGAMILVLAIVLTVAASYALSLDIEEKQVTDYEYVADLTGLFDSEQAPTYIEYNPSSNYTGYFTDPSTKYWDGVDATLTAQRNQYKVNLAPTASVDAPLDMSSETSDAGTWLLRYYYTADNFVNVTPSHMSLADLLADLGYSSYDQVILIADQTSWTASEGFASFIYDSAFDKIGTALQYDHSIWLVAPGVTGQLNVPGIYAPTVYAEQLDRPILAAAYDGSTGYVTLYYDAEMTQSAGLYSPSSTYIMWGGSGVNTTWHLGSTFTQQANDYPDDTYLDIRYGVNQNEN